MDRERVQLITPVKPSPGKRPLSPRLIYHWPIGMAASFLHRVSGVALTLFIPFGLWFLIQISKGEDAFTRALQFINHPLSNLLLFALLLGFIYHLINGLRFIFLDRGIGIDIMTARKSAWFTLIFSFLLSVVIFFS